VEYTFFLAGHGTVYKIHHILGHREGLVNIKNTEIMSHVLLHLSGIKLEINSKRNCRAGPWWLTPVILASQEAKIRQIKVRTQPKANSSLDLISKKSHTHTKRTGSMD
jgi:hypothetical protein